MARSWGSYRVMRALFVDICINNGLYSKVVILWSAGLWAVLFFLHPHYSLCTPIFSAFDISFSEIILFSERH